MEIYKVYLSTKTKSDHFSQKEANKKDAVKAAIKYAKAYGFRGKITVHNVYIRQSDRTWKLVE